jgi:hypothetical protein
VLCHFSEKWYEGALEELKAGPGIESLEALALAEAEVGEPIARLRWVDGKKLKEGMLNRVEAGIWAFDPCLSCSTHAYGAMPLTIELREADGTLVDSVSRGWSARAGSRHRIREPQCGDDGVAWLEDDVHVTHGGGVAGGDLGLPIHQGLEVVDVLGDGRVPCSVRWAKAVAFSPSPRKTDPATATTPPQGTPSESRTSTS